MAQQVEIWTCLGQRLGRSGKVSYVWQDADGKELWFSKLKGTAGGIYEVEAERKPEGITVSQAVKYLHRHADADVIRLEDQAAAKEIERSRLEKSDKRIDELDKAIQPLLEVANRTKSYAGRQALIEYVTRRILRG